MNSLLRSLIRETLLLEDMKGFLQRTKGIDYMSNFDDPTFDEPYQKELPHKEMAKDVKRAWAAEADHKFMETLIKIHWVGGLDWEKKLDRFLSLGGNNEISTMGYLPNSLDVRSSWGTIGIVVQGRTTLATNDMNTVTSGYLGQLSPEIHKKYASSGTPKRPTMFRGPDAFSGGSSKYILDKDSFDQNAIRRNEFIVDNWKPIGLVMGAIDAALFLDSVRAAVKGTIKASYLDYAKGMLKHDLPMYDRQMKPINRKKLEEATRGEGKDEIPDFTP